MLIKNFEVNYLASIHLLYVNNLAALIVKSLQMTYIYFHLQIRIQKIAE